MKPSATQLARRAHRKAEAKRLRQMGYTFAAIGRHLRVTRQRAAILVQGD